MSVFEPGRVCLLFIEVDARHAGPRQSVAVEQLSKELGHVAEFVRL